MSYSVTNPNNNKTYTYGRHRKKDAEKLAERLGVRVHDDRNSDDGHDAAKDEAILRGTWKHR